MTRNVPSFSREWVRPQGSKTRACKDSPPWFPQAFSLKDVDWTAELYSRVTGGLRHSTNGVEDPDTPTTGVEDPDTQTKG